MRAGEWEETAHFNTVAAPGYIESKRIGDCPA
jgi:hypothetical protein